MPPQKKVRVQAVGVDECEDFAHVVTESDVHDLDVREVGERSDDDSEVDDVDISSKMKHVEIEEQGDNLPGNYAMYDVDGDGEYLDMTNQRLTELEDLSEYTKIVELVLRLNRLGNDCFSKFNMLTGLKRVDLYENHLTPIKGNPFSALSELEELDLSFNEIRYPRGFEGLVKLAKLYLSQNKIAKITPGLEVLSKTLQMLELGSNRIRTVENINVFSNLTELYLGKNKITRIEGIDKLTNLRILSFQCNRIVTIENLDALINLEELYLSENGILRLENQGSLKNLRILDVGRNRQVDIENQEGLENLEELWCEYNKVSHFDFLPLLGGLPRLHTLYFEHNPASFEHDYHDRVKAHVKGIQQIDAHSVNP